MRLELVIAVLGGAGTPPTEQSGVYVWTDIDAPDASVLYIGEADNLARRLKREEEFIRSFLKLRDEGNNLWDSAGCGLEAVLGRHPSRQAFTWPYEAHERKHVETALIRLAALTGATPPAQGAGWDYDRGKSHSDVQASKLLKQWFHRPHPGPTHRTRPHRRGRGHKRRPAATPRLSHPPQVAVEVSLSAAHPQGADASGTVPRRCCCAALQVGHPPRPDRQPIDTRATQERTGSTVDKNS